MKKTIATHVLAAIIGALALLGFAVTYDEITK